MGSGHDSTAPMNLFGPDSASARCSRSAIACSVSVPSAQARRCAAAMNMQRDLDQGVGSCGLRLACMLHSRGEDDGRVTRAIVGQSPDAQREG